MFSEVEKGCIGNKWVKICSIVQNSRDNTRSIIASLTNEHSQFSRSILHEIIISGRETNWSSSCEIANRLLEAGWFLAKQVNPTNLASNALDPVFCSILSQFRPQVFHGTFPTTYNILNFITFLRNWEAAWEIQDLVLPAEFFLMVLWRMGWTVCFH